MVAPAIENAMVADARTAVLTRIKARRIGTDQPEMPLPLQISAEAWNNDEIMR
jgi:hypothetical protein